MSIFFNKVTTFEQRVQLLIEKASQINAEAMTYSQLYAYLSALSYESEVIDEAIRRFDAIKVGGGREDKISKAN